MKLLNFHTAAGIRAGCLHPAGVEDLEQAGLWAGPAPVSLADIRVLADRIVHGPAELVPVETLRLAPPVVVPEKIICIGLNYRRHALEAGMDVPAVPVIFGKFANSLSGSGTSVCLPDVDEKYDYEAELAVVVGRTAHNVSAEQALEYVAGYCCANDLSARGAQLATSQWMTGKMLDGFLPLGPYLVTADEVDDPQDLTISCRVNGRTRQHSTTGDMIFGVAELVAFLSSYVTLRPGDVIATGTPEGVLLGSKAPVWLKAGDEIEVEIDHLGTLRNTLISNGTAP